VLVPFVNFYTEGISFHVLFFAADISVRKRTSEFNNGDGASESKRTRVENCYSENSESVSDCDKESGNVIGKGTDEETDKTTNSKRCETDNKTFSENEETVSVVGKESSGADIEVSETDKESSEKKDISGVEKDMTDKDTPEESEVVSSSKRAHEPVGLIEVKKVRISPEMEKQLKLSEGKSNSAERVQNEEKEKQEPVKSVPSVEAKSNLDLAIERVAKGLIDVSETTKSSETARKLNPMPFMRDLHRNLLKKLTRNVSPQTSIC
jgi:hypothetical protein